MRSMEFSGIFHIRFLRMFRRSVLTKIVDPVPRGKVLPFARTEYDQPALAQILPRPCQRIVLESRVFLQLPAAHAHKAFRPRVAAGAAVEYAEQRLPQKPLRGPQPVAGGIPHKRLMLGDIVDLRHG